MSKYGFLRKFIKKVAVWKLVSVFWDFFNMMDQNLVIRKYEVKDYESVRIQFKKGVHENFWKALRQIYDGEKFVTSLFHLSVLCFCTILFVFWSVKTGLLVLLVDISLD